MTRRTFVVVGAGLAGARAAQTLREEGFDGRIVLIGDDSERPYERPPLSKGYLQGAEPREKAYVHAPDYYAEHDIELRTGVTASGLDAADRSVLLSTGERLRADAILLATGAEPRRLTGAPGGSLPGIHVLRTMADSDALRAALDGAGRLVVVGAGWIGSEVAASARALGVEVTIVEPLSVPLERVLGTDAGAVFRDLHRDHGVDLRLGSGVEAFEGAGRVERVRLAGGETVDADVVVLGVGVAPRTRLAEGLLEVSDGIVCDAALRTSVEGVFAAGDVARAFHPRLGAHLRVEHWANALNQGPAAARSMLGRPVSYDRVPYFFSDQYDVGMEYSGHAVGWDRVVFRGDPATREFIAFWLKDDRVLAGMNVNVWDVTEPIQALVRAGRPVDVRALADPDVPLETLVPAGAQAPA